MIIIIIIIYSLVVSWVTAGALCFNPQIMPELSHHLMKAWLEEMMLNKHQSL